MYFEKSSYYLKADCHSQNTHPQQVAPKTKYFHLSEVTVKSGQKVSAGDKIGVSGRTAVFDSKNHLHFEVWVNKKSVPPIDYICAENEGGCEIKEKDKT